MGSRILLDTSVLINLQKNHQSTLKIFNEIKEKVFISRISACEFIYGSRNKREKNINKDFLEYFDILDIREEISFRAYQLLLKYGLNAKFNIADSFIAASATTENVEFWTLNKKHFKTIQEIKFFEV
ncbi:hypothetical protein A2865_01105 [Candidatus Woesebacteria bacterium RIFCSPHIGHO2_01_FULL_39_17]|uniref:PIN domain protein n=2 Tax=Microgenomates group TaxID=1794810 RepID=A0A0H4TVN8_9BACT|nr:PIN domain protein [uncultured Microgenomates bacterium Rifle_16ft_4_minimus_954]KKQ51912.1 MAG: putative ribonuclease VapC [Microgenomates group bacterium GW2011_GWC1_38_12]KKQ93879.1 MAG: putative ribonuclease VapC [Candidatus Woesebacteria bacterium GW2011_GWB1_39_10b]OGM22335.1 MAG: hypothetical protein A2865_01105 [Candidatus Woesebacteria bacterium RIFCSPHIGHO2_01_FULL_39_17]